MKSNTLFTAAAFTAACVATGPAGATSSPPPNAPPNAPPILGAIATPDPLASVLGTKIGASSRFWSRLQPGSPTPSSVPVEGARAGSPAGADGPAAANGAGSANGMNGETRPVGAADGAGVENVRGATAPKGATGAGGAGGAGTPSGSSGAHGDAKTATAGHARDDRDSGGGAVWATGVDGKPTTDKLPSAAGAGESTPSARESALLQSFALDLSPPDDGAAGLPPVGGVPALSLREILDLPTTTGGPAAASFVANDELAVVAPAPVPEPGTLALGAVAAALVGAARTRRRR